MQRNEFFKKLANEIELEDSVNETSVLADIEEWDSLAAVTALAFFKKHLGLNVPADSLKTCKTIGDILDLGNQNYN